MQIEAIDTTLLTRGRLDVNIVRIESPLLFWVQLRNSEEQLKELQEELNLRMKWRGKYLVLWPDDIKEEESVAVKIEKAWYRGIIMKIKRDTLTAQVYLGDWGQTIWRRMGELYLLDDKFRELPWQAIVCGLAHTGPAVPTDTWSEKTKQLCRILALRRQGCINITLPLRHGAALVKLEIKSEDNHRTNNLRDMLIQLGHAQLSRRVTVDTYPAV